MDKYKSLIRYEFKTLRWMMLYFVAVFAGGMALIVNAMKYKRMSFLTHTGIWEIRNVFTQEMNWLYGLLMSGLLLGIILLIYLQFRDAKNIEVGRFLKALPVKSTTIYGIRVGCGMITYTIPFLIYGVALIILRMSHEEWLRDFYSLSSMQHELVSMDSVMSVMMLLGILYLIVTACYLGLMMMQYLVSNRVFALVVGVIMFVVPTYLHVLLGYMLSGILDPFKSFIVLYGVMDEQNYHGFMNGECINIYYIAHIGLKALVLIIVIGIMLWVGYMSSKYFRVEEQGKLIPQSFARGIFKVVATVCIALIPYALLAIGMIQENKNSLVVISILTVVMAIVGGIGSHKVASIGCKER